MTAAQIAPAGPATPAPDPGRVNDERDPGRVVRGTGLLLGATALTGAANYGLSLILVHVLSPVEFSRFSAVTTLLLTVGTVASAAVPWVMAREAALSGRGDARRRRAISFGLAASLALAMVSIVAVTVASIAYASPGLLLGEALACLFILLCAVGVGVLQGEQSFGTLAGIRLLEVGARVVLGVAAAVVGWGSVGVIGAFALGAGVASLWSLVALGRDLWPAGASVGASDESREQRRELWRHAAGLATGQAALSLVLTLDVVIGAAASQGGDDLAGYQALLVLARVPLFVATALATAVFPRLVGVAWTGRDGTARRASRAANRSFREALRTHLLLAVAITAAVASTPAVLLDVVLPAQYVASIALLPPLAVAGFGGATATLLVAYLQARGELRATVVVLLAAVVVSGAGYPSVAGDPARLAWASAAVTITTAAVLFLLVRHFGHSVRATRTALGPLIFGALVWLLLDRLTGHPLLWLVAAMVVGGAVILLIRPRRRRPGPLRVLHLGFEDPARPGAGGGSVRTHEVNSRLAAQGVEVVVVCSRYPGFTERVQDGVRYVPCGWRLGPLSTGHFPSQLAYFGAVLTGLSAMERRYAPDVIVEDFAAPFSSIAVPYLTRTPVVGVVQWLFAADKARQYKLPFHLVERVGVSSHDVLVAVSADLADELRGRNRDAEVHALPNGLEPAAWTPAGSTGGRDHLLYLGRLEIAQKGLDLLLAAFAKAAPDITADLHVAGDGPDAEVLAAQARELGIADRVHWLGRVDGAARFDLLAGAQLVCMPSRYETFGMVAAESLAVGTPVIAFDIACLRALVSDAVGLPVPAGDVDALAAGLVALANDPARCRQLGAAGPDSVRHLDWDLVAADQLAVYREAAAIPAA